MIGLSLWVASLRRTVHDLSRPQLNAPVLDLYAGSVRSETFSEGETLRQRGDRPSIEEAVRRESRALALFRSLGEPRQADVLYSLGAHLTLDSYAAAVHAYEESLALYRAQRRDLETGRTLNDLAASSGPWPRTPSPPSSCRPAKRSRKRPAAPTPSSPPAARRWRGGKPRSSWPTFPACSCGRRLACSAASAS